MLTAEVSGSFISLGEVNSNSEGIFNYVLSPSNLTVLGQGLRKFKATVRDDSGNSSTSVLFDALIDTQAEFVPIISSVGGTDSVISSSNGDQIIIGTAAVGRPVFLKAIVPASNFIKEFETDLGTSTPDLNGVFKAVISNRDIQDLGQLSAIKLIASQHDAVGNFASSAPFVFNIDTLAPSIPTITKVGGADSIVTSPTDALIIGSASAGSTVSLFGSDD